MPVVLLAAILLGQPTEITPEIARLENGLQVVVVEDHTLPLISVQLWFRVGSADDDPARPGMCHVARTLLEDRHDAALRLRAAGARFESRTLRDACFFASLVPATTEFLEYVLRIEADCVQPRSVTRGELAVALGAAARDFGLDPNDPEYEREQRLLAALFPDHPYQHWPGLVAETLKGVSPADVDEFVKRRFAPGNATLLIIGDVQPPQAQDLVRRYFDALPWTDVPRHGDVPVMKADQIRLPSMVTNRAGIDFAWVGPPAGSDESIALTVLMHRLCNSVDGPLFRRLTAAGYAPPTWHCDAWRAAGLLTLNVECGEARRHAGTEARSEADGASTSRAAAESEIDRITQIVRDELERAEQSAPSEIELNRARAFAAREGRNRRAAFGDRALGMGEAEMVAGDLVLADWEVRRLSQVRVGDLQRAAAYLREARSVSLPRGAASASDGNELSPPATLVRPLRGEPPEQLDSAAALELLAHYAIDAPAVRSPKSPATITTRVLDNGVKVTVCAVPGLETAQVRTRLTAKRALWPSIACLLAVGSTRHSVAQYRDYLSYHGLDLHLLDWMTPGFVSQGPADHVAQMVELQAELIRYPDCSDAAWERGRIAARGAWNTFGFDDANRVYLPPGLICSEPSNVWGLSDWTDSRAVLDRLATLLRVEVLVVGDVMPDAIKESVATAWSGWHADAEPAPQSSPAEDSAGLNSRSLGTVPSMFACWSYWFYNDSDPPSVVVGTTLAHGSLDQPLRELAMSIAGRALGVPDTLSPALDARRAWLWTSRRVGPDDWSFSARPRAVTVTVARNQWADQMRCIHYDQLPERDLAAALRLTRADRVLSLDAAGPIAVLLERGITQPWDLIDERTSQGLSGLLSDAFNVDMLSTPGPSD